MNSNSTIVAFWCFAAIAVMSLSYCTSKSEVFKPMPIMTCPDGFTPDYYETSVKRTFKCNKV